MADKKVEFGLTLANRGVLFGVTTVEEMLQMTEIAESSGVYDWVWVGDSILAKPRLEAVALLSALAARTKRLRMGPACMASMALRDPIILACQWASLDLISGGRTVFVACTGLGSADAKGKEAGTFKMERKDRAPRMEEEIEIFKRLWTEEHVSFSGNFYSFEDVTVEPKPAQKPRPPIWIAHSHKGRPKLIERARRRTARLADGYMAAQGHPEEYRSTLNAISGHMKEYGRDPATLSTALYYNINVNEDRQAAFEESTRFLNAYYMTNFKPEVVESWLAYGSPEQCIARLRQYADVGIQMITLRLTGWDQRGQLKRCIEEVLPYV
ncbi:MAG: LLM class flavin-dependent oxidoreductase [Deltaproteobacteria bacterium]|nr:LLM class flavin-dependent oxidoreductase [Deltaproteobacteria bacterium]